MRRRGAGGRLPRWEQSAAVRTLASVSHSRFDGMNMENVVWLFGVIAILRFFELR